MIAFTGGVREDRNVYVMDVAVARAGASRATSSKPRKLTKGPFFSAAPSWSPDGRRIAFVSDRTGQIDIFVMDVHEGSVQRLTRHGGLYPAWSPDGRKIAFSANGALSLMDIDGGNVRRLDAGKVDADRPCWSPDGKWIAFGSTNRSPGTMTLDETLKFDPGVHIELINVKTGRRLALPGTEGGALPDWSPDGKRIAFQLSFNVWVAEVPRL